MELKPKVRTPCEKCNDLKFADGRCPTCDIHKFSADVQVGLRHRAKYLNKRRKKNGK